MTATNQQRKSLRLQEKSFRSSESTGFQYANVSFTITTFKREEGIHGGVTFIPIIPYILDAQENIEDVIERAKEAKAEYVLHGSMTMRSYQEERMYSLLKDKFPNLVEKYKELYIHGYEPKNEYMRKISLLAHRLCRKHQILDRIPRYIPEGTIENNLRVSTVLFELAYYSEIKGLADYKVRAYRYAAQSIENLDVDLKGLERALPKR